MKPNAKNTVGSKAEQDLKPVLPENLKPEIRAKLDSFENALQFMPVDNEVLLHCGLSKADELKYYIYTEWPSWFPPQELKTGVDEICANLYDLAKSKLEQWQEPSSTSVSSFGEFALSEAVEAYEETEDPDNQITDRDMVLFETARLITRLNGIFPNSYGLTKSKLEQWQEPSSTSVSSYRDLVIFETAYLMMAADRLKAKITEVEDQGVMNLGAYPNGAPTYNQRQEILSIVDKINARQYDEDYAKGEEYLPTLSNPVETLDFLLELDGIFPQSKKKTYELLRLMNEDDTDPEILGQTVQGILEDFENLEQAAKTLQALVPDSRLLFDAINTSSGLREIHDLSVERVYSTFGDVKATNDKLTESYRRYQQAESRALLLRKLLGFKEVIQDFIEFNERRMDNAKRDLEQLLAEPQPPKEED